MVSTRKSIWIVEQGEYSDYRVVGVFSSEANAKLIADTINASEICDGASVEERPIDPAVKELNAGMNQWIVWMLRDGSVERCEPYSVSSYQLVGEIRLWERTKARAYYGTETQDCLDATVWARNHKHAVKIVNEKRAQMVASGEWS